MSYFEDFENNIIFGDSAFNSIINNVHNNIKPKYKRASKEDSQLAEFASKGIYVNTKFKKQFIKDMSIEELKKLKDVLEKSYTTGEYKGRREYFLPLITEELNKKLCINLNY